MIFLVRKLIADLESYTDGKGNLVLHLDFIKNYNKVKEKYGGLGFFKNFESQFDLDRDYTILAETQGARYDFVTPPPSYMQGLHEELNKILDKLELQLEEEACLF